MILNNLLKNIKKFITVLLKLFVGLFIALPFLVRKEKYLISLFGTGDTVMLCGLLPEYIKKYPKKFTIIANIKHREIIQLFGYDNEVIYITPRKADWSFHFFTLASYVFKHIVFCCPYKSILWPDWKAGKQIVQNGILTMYKRELHLADDCAFLAPRYPNISELDLKGKERISQIIKDKTVILAPNAISVSNLTTKPVMERLAQLLLEKGYNVYTNGGPGEALPGTKALLLSYSEMGAAANSSNITLVSARSGLCDVFAFSNFNMVILYPTQETFSSYSLNRLFGKNDKCLEVVVPQTSKCQNDVIEELLNSIEKNYN